jgi:hypothetical protein
MPQMPPRQPQMSPQRYLPQVMMQPQMQPQMPQPYRPSNPMQQSPPRVPQNPQSQSIMRQMSQEELQNPVRQQFNPQQFDATYRQLLSQSPQPPNPVSSWERPPSEMEMANRSPAGNYYGNLLQNRPTNMMGDSNFSSPAGQSSSPSANPFSNSNILAAFMANLQR